MSKKNSQPAPEQKTKVLSTGAFGTIMKSILICAIIGAIIGIGIMVASTFGVALLDSPTAQRRQRAAQTVSEEGVQNTEKLDFGDDIKFKEDVYEFKYDGKFHTVEIEVKLPKGTSVAYAGNSVQAVGEYTAYAVLYGEGYNEKKIETTIKVVENDIVVVDSKDNVLSDEQILPSKSFSYDGKTVYSLSYTGKFPDGVTATWTNNKHKDVTDGKELVTLTLSGYGYKTREINAYITVNKGNLKKTYGIDLKDEEFTYDGKAHSLSYSYSDTLPEGVNANWTNNSLTNTGTALVSVTFTDEYKRYNDLTLSATITVNPADISDLFVFKDTEVTYEENAYRVIKNEGTAELPNGIKVSYVYNGEVTDTAPEFTEVGKYTITLLAKGNDNYKEVKIDAVLNIKKISISSADVSIKRSQSFNSNSKNNLPKYTIYPDAPIEFLTESEVAYYLVDDNGEKLLTEGLTKPGQYDVRVVIESEHYIFDTHVTVNISYSPVIILYAILVGAVIGLVLGIIISICGGSNDKFSQRHFAVPREGILKVRGSILCESRAKCKNTKNTGRLYLTPQTIEFYAEDYKKSENNFLLNLADIRCVQVLSSNKIVIHANHKEFTFTVPAGQADEWRYQIVKA